MLDNCLQESTNGLVEARLVWSGSVTETHGPFDRGACKGFPVAVLVEPLSIDDLQLHREPGFSITAPLSIL